MYFLLLNTHYSYAQLTEPYYEPRGSPGGFKARPVNRAAEDVGCMSHILPNVAES